jgi:hypothetical protein
MTEWQSKCARPRTSLPRQRVRWSRLDAALTAFGPDNTGLFLTPLA